jgi:hypothetical protein
MESLTQKRTILAVKVKPVHRSFDSHSLLRRSGFSLDDMIGRAADQKSEGNCRRILPAMARMAQRRAASCMCAWQKESTSSRVCHWM